MADGKVTIETALDASGVTQGIEFIKKALAAIGIGKLVKDIVDTGANFEETMSKVGAISGATQEEMKKLTETAKEMGRTSVFSATEAAQGLTFMGMAGWSAEQMMAGLPGVMNLAASSGEDLALVSDIVTDAMTAFGMKAEDAGHFADVIAEASRSANTNVSMLGESFKYVAPVAGSLGMSVEDTAVALGLMANSGIKSSQAGTALRAALTNLAKPSKTVGTYMDKLGITLEDEQGNVKSLDTLIGDLRESFAGLTDAEKAEAAAGMFGKEAMSGMLAIINASDKDLQNLQAAIEGASEAYGGLGTATGMAEQMVGNFSGQMTLMKSALEGMKLAIWDNLQAPLTNIASVATDAITKLTEAFQEGGTGQLVSAAYAMMGDFMSGITASLPSIIAQGTAIVTSIAQSIAQAMPQLVPQGIQMLLTLGASIVQNIPTIVSAGVDIIKGIVTGIINSVPMLIEQGPALINQFWDAIDSGIGILLEAGLNMIVQIAQGIWDNIPLIIENAGEIVKAIFNTIMHLDLLNAGKTLFKNLGAGIKSMGPTVKGKAVEVGKKALQAFKNIDWLGLGKNIISFIANGLRSVGSKILDALVDWGMNGFKAFKNIDWLGLGKAVLRFVINGIKALGSMLLSGLKTVGTNAFNAFKGINWLSLGKHLVTGIASGVTGAASSLFKSLKNLAKSALEKASGFFKIGSPSKLFRDEIGKWIPAGVAVGVDNKAYLLEDSIEEMGVDAVEKAEEFADEMTEAMIPDTPNYDGYYRDLVGMLNDFDADMPAVKMARSGVISDTITRAKQMAEAIKDELRGEFSGIKEDVKNGLKEGLDGVSFNIDGRKAGKLLAAPIANNMPVFE